MPKDISFPQYSHFAMCEHLLTKLQRRYNSTYPCKMQALFACFPALFIILLQYTGTPCPRTVTGFCRCFAFQIGKICYHHCIIRHFQFRKCLPVYSNRDILPPLSSRLKWGLLVRLPYWAKHRRAIPVCPTVVLYCVKVMHLPAAFPHF